MSRHRVAQQGHHHAGVVGHVMEVLEGQVAGSRRPGEDGHQVVGVAVLAHQHRRQLFGDLHQVGQVGDVVLGDEVLDHADAFQARACAQGLGHLALVDLRHLGQQRIGLVGIGHLELHQQAAQLTLVARQRAVQQQGPFGGIELQQAAQGVDVLLHQGRSAPQVTLQPVARGAEHGHQVLGRVLDVFVEVEEKRALFVGATPAAMAGEERLVVQAFVAMPQGVAEATAREVVAQALQHRARPHQMPAHQREHGVPVAPHIEAPRMPQREREHEVGAHAVEHGRIVQAGRGPHARVRQTSNHGHLLVARAAPPGAAVRPR
jgi:hypothetical protein